MSNKGRTFLISDLHLGQRNCFKGWVDKEGKETRPFSSIEEFHDVIIERWNGVVTSSDKVYVLGDVVMRKEAFPILDKLLGKKILIMGNHDIFGIDTYIKYFDEVYGVKVLAKQNLILSHMPIQEDSLWRWRAERWWTNVHGHTHHNLLEDSRYINVCCEVTDFTPILLDHVLIKARSIVNQD